MGINGKGKSPVRSIRGSHASQFSLHPARAGNVRLAIREPGARTRSVYFKIDGVSTTTQPLQGLDEASFEREYPSPSDVGSLGYQPSGADIIDQTYGALSQPSYSAETAWQRLGECGPFVDTAIPPFQERYLHARYDGLPSVKGRGGEKLVAAI